MYPTTGWLAKYLRYTEVSAARESYHFWTGVSVIAATLQRNVCVEFGHTVIWPNHYILLVGPTGNAKSSAIAIGEDLLRQCGTVNVLPEEISKQAIVKELRRVKLDEAGNIRSEDSTGLLIATELTDFLSKDNYKRGLVPFLTNLYDGKLDYRDAKITREGTSLKNVCFCFLGATTSEWLTELAPTSVFTGGFMGRVVVVGALSRRYNFMPPRRDPHVRSELVEDLGAMSAWKGKAQIDQDALLPLEDHSKAVYGSYGLAVDDARAEGWYARKEAHTLKLCLVLAASHGHTSIQRPVVEEALGILYDVELKMMTVYDRIDVTEGHKKRERIIEALVKAEDNSLTSRDLWRKVGHRFDTMKEFEEHLRALREMEKVELASKEGKGRPTYLYKLILRKE